MRLNLLLFFALVLLLAGFADASISSFSYLNNPTTSPSFSSYYGSDIGTYWPILNNASDCRAREDLMLQVFPASCEPMVVRSDLLEEQNVPVFCQLSVLKINPLIDIKEIKSLSFSGNYPKEVSGVAFHPAQAALRSNDVLLGSPITNNIGYAVVVLKQQKNETTMPDKVVVNLTASVYYDSGNVLGIGRAEFLLNEQNDEEWNQNKFKQSFWSGRFFVRVDELTTQYAKVSLYNGDVKFNTVTVPIGRTSDNIYLPGSYCQAALKVEFPSMTDEGTKKAIIEISDDKGTDKLSVYEGSKFMNDRCVVEKIIIDNSTGETGSVVVKCPDTRINLFLKETSTTNSPIQDASLGSKEAEGNFTKSIENYKNVASLYPGEKSSTETTTYGEQALIAAITLSEQLGKQKTAFELYKLFVDTYPKSTSAASYNKILNSSYYVDSTKSNTAVKIDNQYKNVRLVSLEEPKEKSVGEFTYGGRFVDIPLNGKYIISPASEDGKIVEKYIQLTYLDENNARISTNCNESGSRLISNDFKIGESRMLCGQPFVLKKATLKKSAVIRLIPEAYNTQTRTNLTIRIGIEKRAIQLSPQKTKEMIETLNKSIAKWDKLSTNLGTVVTGLKTACLATAAVLTFKNLIGGLSGQSLARQQVMPYWKGRCSDEIEKWGSMDKCYDHYSSEISGMVDTRTKYIKEYNDEVAKIQGDKTSLFGDKSVDAEATRIKLAESVKSKYGDETITLPDNKYVTLPNGTKVNTVSVKDLLNDQAVKDGTVSSAEMRELYVNLKSKEGTTGEYSAFYNKEIGNQADRMSLSLAASYTEGINNKSRSLNLPAIPNLEDYGKSVVTDVKPVDSTNAAALSGKISGDAKYISYIPVTGTTGPNGNGLKSGTYLAELEQTGSGYRVKSAQLVDSWDGAVPKLSGTAVSGSQLTDFPIVTAKDSISYQAALKNPEVRYYETEPYKGMPALVPIDINNGWYAATKQTLPALGGIGAFDASGKVSSFWLCNAGKNGRAEFNEGMGDDTCRQFNTNTGQSLSDFPGLSAAQTRNYVNKAIQAIQEAASQYSSMGSSANILGSNIKKGKPMTAIAEADCTSFMSVQECNLLYNLCDPVICPNTRCNLGGMYPVSDVVQSGIIGSLFLCLPNFPQVKVPICLTGLQAGIDGYVGILKAHMKCLNESLTSGKMVGTCDLIYSIYTCEFFWRELSPIIKLLLPAMLAKLSGQGARGGAEYLTVSAAFQNTQKSIDYLTNVYAVNAFKAFQLRSIEEAGTEICKGFISSSWPSQIKSFVQPDSPPQFHGYFSSTKYTSATVPATSQYKVFYYIFAGKDSGVSYRVYLKGTFDSGYYASNPYLQVATGFVAKGETETQTKDFTAPEGYTELCININGEETCGFKQVSSSFAVNYITDQVAANELTKTGISSEKDCISGSANAFSLLNPNLGAAASEAANPDLYRRGIVRVCSTANPGSSTDPTRYVEVGTCGEDKIKCWLDKNSVNNAITDNNNGTRNSTLSELKDLTSAQLNNLQKDLGVYDSSDGAKVLSDFSGKVEKIKGMGTSAVISSAHEAINQSLDIEGKLFFNVHKAQIIYFRGQIYEALARYLWNNKVSVTNVVKDSTVPSVILSYSGGALSATDKKTAYIGVFGDNCDNIKWSMDKTKWYVLKNKIGDYSLITKIQDEISSVSINIDECTPQDFSYYIRDKGNYKDVTSGDSTSSTGSSDTSSPVLGGFDMLRLWANNNGNMYTGDLKRTVYVGYFEKNGVCFLGWSLERNSGYVTLGKAIGGGNLESGVLSSLDKLDARIKGASTECLSDSFIGTIESEMTDNLNFDQGSVDGMPITNVPVSA